jgi:hypothetical protein
VKTTWKDHIDYKDLCEALSLLESTGHYFNNRMKEAEGRKKVIEIQYQLIGLPEVCYFSFSKIY